MLRRARDGGLVYPAASGEGNPLTQHTPPPLDRTNRPQQRGEEGADSP